jgi:hypothetical protein
MPDKIDKATDREQADLDRAISAARGVEMPVGKPGECDLCGEWTGRLVQGACSPCRDRFDLP